MAEEQKAPHPTDPNRYADGTVRPNNGLRVTHGGRRQLAIDETTTTALYQQWVSDLGGEQQLTAAQRTVLLHTVQASQIAETAVAYLRRTGQRSLTSQRTQAAIKTFLAAADRASRGATILGLERRTKRISEIAQWAAANQNG